MAHGNRPGVNRRVYIGTAGWNIPTSTKNFFPHEGTQLERYADVLECVEITSTFLRDHRRETFARWASITPRSFKFSVKLSQRFTHQAGSFSSDDLERVLDGYNELEEKLDVVLLQFPPTQPFDPFFFENLLESVRHSFLGSLVIEPRHSSWHCKEAIELMQMFNVSKVVADPERCEFSKRESVDYGGVSYLRFHGTPDTYKSSYGDEVLRELKDKILSTKQDLWVIFEPTSFGHATENALKLKGMTSGAMLS